MSLSYQGGLSLVLFDCVKICFLLILWNESPVQAEQTYGDKILHRRQIGSTPFDLRNIHLEPHEKEFLSHISGGIICLSPIYRKYQNNYPKQDKIELTNEQLDELVYDLLFVTLTNFFQGRTQSGYISIKNFPDVMKFNLQYNYRGDPKFLEKNHLNLEICRTETYPDFYLQLISTYIRETIPPLKELIENPIPLKPLGSGPYDIRNVYLEPYEKLSPFEFSGGFICRSPIYSRYQNNHPKQDKIELTNEQLNELEYDLLLAFTNYFQGKVRSDYVSIKNFPDGMKWNLQYNYPGDTKFLEKNHLNLEICRTETYPDFYLQLIMTNNRETIPPLNELIKTTLIPTSTSQTTTSQTTTSPVKTFPTKLTTVTPIQEGCSFDIMVKRRIYQRNEGYLQYQLTILTKNAFSKNDWIPALHNYSQIDRPSCLNKQTTQLSTDACLCTVNRNLQTWVCQDQQANAKKAILDSSLEDFYMAVQYFSEVFSICAELKYKNG